MSNNVKRRRAMSNREDKPGSLKLRDVQRRFDRAAASFNDAAGLAAESGSARMLAPAEEDEEDAEVELDELLETEDALGDDGSGTRGFSLARAYAFARAVRIA